MVICVPIDDAPEVPAAEDVVVGVADVIDDPDVVPFYDRRPEGAAEPWEVEHLPETHGVGLAFDVVGHEAADDGDAVGDEAEVYQVSLCNGQSAADTQSYVGTETHKGHDVVGCA
jgi:hypothetical protein